MAEAWGIHIPAVVGSDPVEGGFVSLGWPALGDIFALPPDRDVFKRLVAQSYPEKKPGAIPVDAGTLFKFAFGVKQGDLIVYPSKHDRMIHIGKATGRKWHDASGATWRADYGLRKGGGRDGGRLRQADADAYRLGACVFVDGIYHLCGSFAEIETDAVVVGKP